MLTSRIKLSSGLDPLDPTPKKVLTTPCQDVSDIGADFAYETYSGVGSPIGDLSKSLENKNNNNNKANKNNNKILTKTRKEEEQQQQEEEE